ncbi:hypothetical protein ACIQVO_38850 [Streptomyces sp. NPDC101062]|uniref:hypothetical protein n=1 Tax=unclassified Streptomyces TaxID=2593676 RepID=UPI00380DD0A2
MTPLFTIRTQRLLAFLLFTCAAALSACLGLLLGDRITAVTAAGAAGLGAAIGWFLVRRQLQPHFEPKVVSAKGYAEGIADAVLLSIATYQAAVFPLVPDGVSEEERSARRTVAYRAAAHDGLPLPVRISAAEALEALDQGLDTDRTHAAMTTLSLAVYGHRTGR